MTTDNRPRLSQEYLPQAETCPFSASILSHNPTSFDHLVSWKGGERSQDLGSREPKPYCYSIFDCLGLYCLNITSGVNLLAKPDVEL